MKRIKKIKYQPIPFAAASFIHTSFPYFSIFLSFPNLIYSFSFFHSRSLFYFLSHFLYFLLPFFFMRELFSSALRKEKARKKEEMGKYKEKSEK